MKNWFNSWEWLKNSSGNEWSYTRVIGAICMLLFQPIELTYVYLSKDIKEITNAWQWAVIALPALTTTFLFLLEVIKENKAISFKIADKEYGFHKMKEDKPTKNKKEIE